MKKRGKMKSQAATEFLMTYGWMVTVVMVAIGALAYFGVLSPDKFLPRKCVLEAGLGCKDFKVNEDSAKIVIDNSKGEDITVTRIDVSGCSGTASGLLNNGQSGTFTIGGCNNAIGGKVKGNVNISYNSESGLNHKNVGNLIDKIQGGTSAPSDWYDSAWPYRKKISLLSSQVPSDLTNFPALISISDTDLSADAQSDGDDILFTASNGKTKLSHELEHYSSGSLIAWVKLSSLSSSSDTEIYMYYGNNGALNQENMDDVWSNGYEAVWHIHDDFLDSAKNNDGTNSGSLDSSGIIGDGQDFTPESYINFGTWSVSSSQLTIQAWANFDDFNQDDPRILTKSVSGGVQDHVFMLSLYNSGPLGERYLRSRTKTGSSDSSGTNTLSSVSDPLDPDTWHLTAATYDGANMKIFKDGGNEVAIDSHNGDLRENNWEIWAGHNPGGSFSQYSLDGKLDEIRISSVARSADWLTTEYNNQNTPLSFHSVGSEESWV
jgi:hypothetical protein